jgi:hypothetical protein
MSELSARSNGIIQANTAALAQQRTFATQREFVSEIDQLIGRMEQFDSQADVHLGRFPGVGKEYEVVTASIAAYIARERRTGGNQNAPVMRRQLVVAANQASLQTEQMHNQGISLQSAL